MKSPQKRSIQGVECCHSNEKGGKKLWQRKKVSVLQIYKGSLILKTLAEIICSVYAGRMDLYAPSVDAVSIITLQHGISTHVKTAGIRRL